MHSFITDKLAQGVFVKQMIILAAAVSRIWYVCHVYYNLTNFCSEL